MVKLQKKASGMREIDIFDALDRKNTSKHTLPLAREAFRGERDVRIRTGLLWVGTGIPYFHPTHPVISHRLFPGKFPRTAPKKNGKKNEYVYVSYSIGACYRRHNEELESL